MNKLQLYIAKSAGNYKSLLNLNPSEDVRRHVSDVRHVLEFTDYDTAEINIFYLLKATAEGVFVTILRTIPQRKGDHLAAWIYVPNGIVIAAEQLEGIVQRTARKVSGAGVGPDDIAALREAFATEYAVNPDAPAITAMRGAEYAWRTYGGDSGVALVDFMGRGLWQQSYLPYEGVLLIDELLGVKVNAQSLAHVPLGEPATILPPEKTDEGFTAHVFGRTLDRPLRGTLGAELEIVWSRPGFEDVTVTSPVDEAVYTPQLVSTVDAQKVISPASFHVTSQATKEQLPDCQIRVNGLSIEGEGRSFNSDQLKSASVVISCEGYNSFTGHINLASTTRALVQLQERRKVYRFEVPVASSDMGAPIKFEIHTKRPLTASPLEGYSLLDDMQEGPTRTNRLGFSGGGSTLYTRIIWAAIGLVAGILISLMVTCSSSGGDKHLAPAADPNDTTAIVNTPPQAPAAPEVKVVDVTPAKKEEAKEIKKEEEKKEEIKPEAAKPEAAKPESAKPEAKGKSVTHTVTAGQNLTVIAAKYKVTVDDIRKVNNLTSDNLAIDQKLVIPQK